MEIKDLNELNDKDLIKLSKEMNSLVFADDSIVRKYIDSNLPFHIGLLDLSARVQNRLSERLESYIAYYD